MSLREFILQIYRAAPEGIDLLAYVGGGALRAFFDGTDVKDYDLFFASETDWRLACSWFRSDPRFRELTQPGEESYPSFQREGYPPFNLIGFRYHKSIQALATSFDFRCCAMAAEVIEPGKVATFVADGAAEDARDRVLHIMNMQPQARVKRRSERYMKHYRYRKGSMFDATFRACANVHGSAGGY